MILFRTAYFTSFARERAPAYSITSSARPRIDCGTLRPSAFAVFRLTSSSTLVDCCTGRSAGFFPLRFLPVEMPARQLALLTLPTHHITDPAADISIGRQIFGPA